MNAPAVNPIVLRWARDTAGLSLDDAARALGIKSADRLLSYEVGDAAPSRSLLLRMSKQYRRSLLTLYLEAPPREAGHGRDFRTLPADRDEVADARLGALLRDVAGRQELVRATLVEEEEREPLRFVRSGKIDDGVERLAKNISQEIGFRLDEYRAARSTIEAFGYLRALSERSGVFVLLLGNLGNHHSSIPVETFRGFAIADPVAPFVVINDQDSKTAWSFTLLHELAHLWLGETGVSGSSADHVTERFCNDVASALLLPAAELSELLNAEALDANDLVELLRAFASKRYVSTQLVAYRLYLAGRLSRAKWMAVDQQIQAMWRTERAKEKAARADDAGPSFYVVRAHRLGSALLSFVDAGLKSGSLTVAKAAKLLGVKPRSVSPLLGSAAGLTKERGRK
ncbi:MAG: XRE family transcriptional regulator [Xanthomonadaceae bacterium]|jgi:Zn-dependent peptidase ImmA (M78 family)|nr:XRE family transcriptional regulator [Xanthomonadaceae bacterium]